MLIDVGHIVKVEGLVPAGGVDLLHSGADIFVAAEIDPEAAVQPEHRLDHTLHIVAVGLGHVGRAMDSGAADRNLPAGALHGDVQRLLRSR